MSMNMKQTWPGIPLDRVHYDRYASRASSKPGAKPEGRRDYRTSLRKHVPFEALVTYGMTYSVPWHILNLGLGGALVDMDSSALHVGSTIEFELRFKYCGHQIEHRIPARVVRFESRGVALQFGDYDDATYTDLTNLLYAFES